MKVRKSDHTFFICLEKGDEILQSLLKVCVDHHISCGYIHGIGACEEAYLSSFDPQTKTFHETTITGMLDLVCLEGNVVLNTQGDVRLHLHSLFAYRKDEIMHSISGHLQKALISYTGEIILQSFDETIQTRYDPELGIEVWDLEQGTKKCLL